MKITNWNLGMGQCNYWCEVSKHCMWWLQVPRNLRNEMEMPIVQRFWFVYFLFYGR